jgi:hypothetical protein
MTLLPFHELNQEKKFFSEGNGRRLKAILTIVKGLLKKHITTGDDIRDLLALVESQLEISALQFFSSNGWLSTRCIGLL